MIKNDCELRRFFIFNSTLGPKEGQVRIPMCDLLMLHVLQIKTISLK